MSAAALQILKLKGVVTDPETEWKDKLHEYVKPFGDFSSWKVSKIPVSLLPVHLFEILKICLPGNFDPPQTPVYCEYQLSTLSCTLLQHSGTCFQRKSDSLSQPLPLNQHLKNTFSQHDIDWYVCVRACMCVCACMRKWRADNMWLDSMHL